MSSGVLQSKRTITELIIQTALKISFGGGVDKYLKSNASGVATWANLMPSGTTMTFYQAVAPLGWRIVHGAGIHDFMPRIIDPAISGVGGKTGGTWIGAGRVVAPAHTHNITDHNHYLAGTGFVAYCSGDGWGGHNSNAVWHETAGVPAWTSNYRNTTGTDSVAGSGVPTTNTTGISLVGIAGNMTAGANSGGPSSVAITHGSAQHAYANVILCTKD